MSILEVKGLQYSYENKKRVLRGISAQMEQGKMYAILGPSGCGKTTLLSLLGGLDSPSSGQILYQGEDIAKTGLADHRRSHVAFIFQSYNLIDYLTPVENVALRAYITPNPPEASRHRVQRPPCLRPVALLLGLTRLQLNHLRKPLQQFGKRPP